MDLETSLLEQGCHGGDDIYVMNLCPQALPLRRRSLWRLSEARKVVQEWVMAVIYVGGRWKTMDSWLKAGGSGDMTACKLTTMVDTVTTTTNKKKLVAVTCIHSDQTDRLCLFQFKEKYEDTFVGKTYTYMYSGSLVCMRACRVMLARTKKGDQIHLKKTD